MPQPQVWVKIFADMKIIDIHTHLELHIPGIPQDRRRKKPPRLFMYLFEKMGYSTPVWKKGNYPEPLRMMISLDNQLRLSMASAENLLGYMDKSGVDYSVAMPIAPFISGKEYLEKTKEFPRILSFTSAHPSDQEWPKTLRQSMEAGCRGLKIHPIAQEINPESQFYFDLMEEFRRYNRPVLTHCGVFEYFITKSNAAAFGKPAVLEKLVSSFPDIPFILGHMGIHEPDEAIMLAEKYENVYLETSFQPWRKIKEAISRAGSHRVLFGSDWPESEQLTPLKIARRAAGKDYALAEAILGKNALALIGPVGDR